MVEDDKINVTQPHTHAAARHRGCCSPCLDVGVTYTWPRTALYPYTYSPRSAAPRAYCHTFTHACRGFSMECVLDMIALPCCHGSRHLHTATYVRSMSTVVILVDSADRDNLNIRLESDEQAVILPNHSYLLCHRTRALPHTAGRLAHAATFYALYAHTPAPTAAMQRADKTLVLARCTLRAHFALAPKHHRTYLHRQHPGSTAAPARGTITLLRAFAASISRAFTR